MKTRLICLLCGALLASVGCAQDRALTLTPVGPAPSLPRAADNHGTLVVYSAWEGLADAGEADWRRHTSFELRQADGSLIRRVKNFRGGPVDDPTPVPLAAGTYRVRVRAQKYGWVTVPVVIEPGRVTCVYLDDTSPPSNSPQESGQLVKLPDGRAVGWSRCAPGN